MHHHPTHPESRLAQNEWPEQLQHGVNEACEPPVLADRQLEGFSGSVSQASSISAMSPANLKCGYIGGKQ
tara:strand:+ start:109 stop:318 length:210 start_codon:yes stop_codon:yes gene_type:complete